MTDAHDLSLQPVLVVGAGIMGVGIAQIAAQAGHEVLLYDSREGAVNEARQKLESQLSKLVERGKFSAESVTTLLQRIKPVTRLGDAASVSLVVEAIVEDLESKRSLFKQLEDIVSPDCIFATNTSSISVTAIGNGLDHPGRLVGMHFFNPVPIMKLVEVVSGLQTDPDVSARVFELGTAWGKTAVHARSTPGFIVNRIARPFYAEALALLQENSTSAGDLDACMRSAGFRMGPCELMDLIGIDTNFSVTQSVYEANFYDKRFVPSLVQRELVDGGLYGRKTGKGFYVYPRDDALEKEGQTTRQPGSSLNGSVTVMGDGIFAAFLAKQFGSADIEIERNVSSPWIGIEIDDAQIRLTDGRPASQVVEDTGHFNIAVFDLPIKLEPGSTLAWSAAIQAGTGLEGTVDACLRLAGFEPVKVADLPALLVARTIAMLINEANDAVTQGVCTEDGADLAMKLGVNYPSGPFEWMKVWSADSVVNVLSALNDYYRGERYRISPGLRNHRWSSQAAAG